MCSARLVYIPPPTLPPPRVAGDVLVTEINMKREADRRKTFEKWPLTFIDTNHLASAGFFFTKLSDVVCCAFCGVQLGDWEKCDNPFKDHQRWSPSCGFIKGLFVGNIPIGSTDQPTTSSEQPTRSYDVYGPHVELRPNSQPERSM